MGGLKWITRCLLTPVVAAGLPIAAAIVAPATAPVAHAATPPPCPVAADHCVDLGTTAVHLTGGLDSPGDEDVFSIAVSDPAGVYMTPSVDAPEGLSGLHWIMRDDQHQIVFDQEMTRSAPTPYFPYFLRQGRFTLTVSADLGARAAAISSYSFTLRTAITETTTIGLNQRVDSSLSGPGAHHIFRFDVPTATRLWPQVITAAYPTSTWMLRDSSGRVLLNEFMQSAFGTGLRQPIWLPAGTNYSLLVEQALPNGWLWDFVSTVSFKLWTLPDSQSFPVAPAASFALPFTSTTAGSGAGSLEAPYATDSYRFSLTSTKTVDVKFSQIGAAGSCRGIDVMLVTPNDVRVDLAKNACPTDLYVQLGTGAYTLVVKAAPTTLLNGTYNGIVAVPYTLNVAETTASPTITLPAVQSFKSTTTPSFNIGTTVATNTATGIGYLESSAAQDVYSFTTTTPNQSVYFRNESYTPNASWKLVAPDGYSLFDKKMDTDTGTILLAQPGNYAVVAYGATSAPVSYSFSTWNVAAPRAKGAVTFTTSKDAPHVMSGRIDVAGIEDEWTFSGTAGQHIFVKNCSLPGCGYDMGWELRAPDGAVLYQYPAVYSPFDPLYRAQPGAIVLPQTGVYSFRVHAQGTSYLAPTVGTATFSYDFEIWNQAPQHPVTPINLDQLVTGAIATAGAIDVYTFTGTAGQQVYLRSEGGPYPYPNPLTWELRGPNGVVVAAPDLYNRRAADSASSNLGRIILPRSGSYSIIVHAVGDATNFTPDAGTGPYSFTVVSIPDPQRFTVSASPFTVTPGLVNGSPMTGAGNIETSGTTDEYTFTAAAGDQFNFASGATASNLNVEYKLIGPDGFTVFQPERLAWPFGGNPGVETLARAGEYRLVALADQGATGTYSFTVTKLTTKGPAQRAVQTHTVPVGGSVSANTITDANGVALPSPGAGVLDGAGDADAYSIDAVSGDAIDIALTSPCGFPSPVSTSWNLRDPNGEIVAAPQGVMSNPWTCDLGPMVLQHTGRYTLTVGLGTVADLMSFKVISLGHLQEAPQAGEPVPAPTLTRSAPSSGVAGQETTVSLYGTNMNAPTAIHVKDGTSELPVTLIEAHGVHGTIPALVATAQVDLRAVVTTTPSNYTISADLPGGATVTLSDPFVVGPETATDDAIEVTTLGLNDLRAGAVNFAYINVTNHSDADVSAKISIDGDAGFPMQSVVATRRDDVIAALRAAGWTDAEVAAAAAQLPEFVLGDPVVDGNGTPRLVTILDIPAQGTRTLKLKITMPAPLVAGSSLGSASISVAATATAATPPPPGPCGTVQTAKAVVDVSTFVPDSAAADALESWTEEFLNQYASWLPPVVRTAIAVTLKAVGTGVLAVPALVGMLLALVLGKVQGLNPDPARLDQLISEIKSAATGMALSSLLEQVHLDTPKEVASVGLDLASRVACDPNALIGPGTGDVDPVHGATVSGGPVRAGQRLPYKVEFENVGTAPVQQVQGDVTLSNQLDWSTFKLEEVNIGGVRVEMLPTDTWSARSMPIDLPVDGTTAKVTVDSVFDPANGHLRVTYSGPDATNDPLHPSPYGDMLPPNTTSPEGEGFFTYSAELKRDASGEVTQAPARITFDPFRNGGSFLDTNTWRNTVAGSDDHPISGLLFKVSKGALPVGDKLSIKLLNSSLTTIANPTVNGMTINVRSGGVDHIYNLPAARWILRGRKYKYIDAKLVSAPIKKATFDLVKGKVTITGKGVGLDALATVLPSMVDVVISAGAGGGQRFCMNFGGLKIQTAKYFTAIRAPAPSGCP